MIKIELELAPNIELSPAELLKNLIKRFSPSIVKGKIIDTSSVKYIENLTFEALKAR